MTDTLGQLELVCNEKDIYSVADQIINKLDKGTVKSDSLGFFFGLNC